MINLYWHLQSLRQSLDLWEKQNHETKIAMATKWDEMAKNIRKRRARSVFRLLPTSGSVSTVLQPTQHSTLESLITGYADLEN